MTTANVNVTKILHKRGNTIQNDNYTGVFGELSVDTQVGTIRVHDGSTAGGTRLATYSELSDLAVGNLDLSGYATSAGLTAANLEIGKLRANITAANAAIVSNYNFLLANAGVAHSEINGVRANITAANVAWTANAAIQATAINSINANLGAFQTYANATFTGGSTYSNANVTAFLGSVTGNIVPSANAQYSLGDSTHWWRDIYVGSNTIYLAGVPLSIDANGDLLVDGNVIQGGNTDLTAVNANITAANSSIQTTNANIGAYQIWANANAGSQTTSINTTNANIGAYQTWANANAAGQTTSINALRANIAAANVEIATLQTQVYSNVNTAAYLAGAVTAGNITAGNLTIETNAVVLGNLRVVGTQTTVNATTLSVDDLWITVADGATQASDANGAGLRVAGALANISYSSVSDSFEFNKAITVSNVNFANGVSILETVANLTNGGNVVSLGSNGNLTLPTNLNFSTSPASQNTGIIFGDGTWQRTAYQGPGSVLVNGTHNATLDSTGNLTVPGDILPNTDNVYDLGSATMRFRHLYVGPGTVYVGNAAIKTTVTGNLILPGITRAVASTAFVEEVEDEGDQTHSFTTNPTIIDNAHYSFLDGNFQNLSFTPATYSSTGIDDQGYIRNITVDTPGVGYVSNVAILAEELNMWATEAADPVNNFNAGDWIEIPFRVITRAGESEYEFDTGGGGSDIAIGTINLHNGGTQNAQILQFTNDGYQAVITGPTPEEGYNAERLIIQGQRGTSGGEGGDVYVWGGDSEVNGGDIKIYAGDADSESSGSGGYVNIDGGNGYDQGGDVTISSGQRTGPSGPHGSVKIQTYAGTWTFDSNGNLILPPAGDILNNSGTSVLGGGGNANTGNVIFDGDTLYVGGVGFLDLDNSDNQIEIGSNNNGPVIVSVNEGANRWEFGANGVLALPPGGDIVNSNGASVLGSDGLTTITGNQVGYILTLTQNANGATPGIDDSATIDYVPTVTLDANDWIGAGSNDPETYATVTFANGETRLIDGWNTDSFGTSGFLSLATGITILGADAWPMVITSYDYSAGNVTPGKAIVVNSNTWKFDTAGNLTFPDGTVQTTAYAGSGTTTNQLVNNEYTVALQSNGAVTIPGTIISGVTDPASYRGFYAAVNQISEQGGGSEDDPSLNQIILSRSANMRGYNLSDDTNDDTFFANGITGSSHVAVINLYGEDTSNPLDLDDIKTFVQTYIDLVLYDGTTLRTDVADIQTAFAAAQTDLVDSLPANALRSDFKFNEIQAVINTAGMTTSGSGSGFVYYYNTDTADYSGSDETDILVAGTGYQINDTITVPGTALGGIAPADNMTITVAGIDGSGGITSIDRSGSMDSTRFANLFVKHFIIEGYEDAYDQGNGIGTDRSECVFTATTDENTQRLVVSAVASGELAPFQVFSQNNDYNYMILHQVSGTAGGAGVYALGGYETISTEANATVYTANGIYYGINDPQYDSPAFGGGDYVSMVNTEVGIFTMVAVNADIDRVSYIGETGADSDGIKILTASFDIGNGALESLPVELVVGNDTWTFENTGNLTLPQTSGRGITFGDGTFQKTAYKRPDNLMLDGGGAATIYEVAVEYAEGGFSATRYGVNTPSFNGGGAELDEPVYYTLDGGGA